MQTKPTIDTPAHWASRWADYRKAMNKETKHTPLPWMLQKTGVVGPLTIIVALDDERIATIDGTSDLMTKDTTNAAFIVRACNSHEALVEACNVLVEYLCLSEGDAMDKDGRDIAALAKAALAQASSPEQK